MDTKFAQKHNMKMKRCKHAVRLSGLGNATVTPRRQVEGHLEFDDGVKRKICALVLEKDAPCELVIGMDFITEHKLSFSPEAKGLEIWDESRGPDNRKIIYKTNCSLPKRKVERQAIMTFRRKREKKKGKKFAKWEEKGISKENYVFLRDLTRLRLRRRPNGAVEEEKFQALFGYKDAIRSSRNKAPATAAGGTEEASVMTASPMEVDEVTAPATIKAPARNNTNFDEKLKAPKCDFPEMQEQLDDLVNEYSEVFAASGSDVGRSRGAEVFLKVNSRIPVNERNYRTPLKLREVLKGCIEELLEAGVIERCTKSQYNSPCLLVPKKKEAGKDQEYRLVVDYRKLNNILETIIYPMPRIQDILCKYQGCDTFSVVDIRHAYYTIRLDKSSRELTAFSCEVGQWQFKFLPQGLKTAPAIFQGRISDNLKDLPDSEPYMDDIITGTKGTDKHLTSLRSLFKTLKKCGYKLKLSKSELMRKKVTFTGVDVSGEGVHVTQSKLDGAEKLRAPTTLSEVKSLLGFTSFLRSHIPYYCEVTGPIQDLVKGKKKKNADVTREWTSTHEKALQELKGLLKKADVLAFPDPQKDFHLYTDASKFHMSGVLMQGEVNSRKVVGYWSKSFKGSQLEWSALVKEARAVVEACKHFSVFILGAKTTLYCDHKPLHDFLRRATKNTMVNRWSLEIQEFDLQFEWVDTESNISDCLSRLVKNELFRPHDEVEKDFPEGGIGKKGKPINDFGQKRKKFMTPMLKERAAAPPMANQLRKSMCLVVQEDDNKSTCEVVNLDTGLVKELQGSDKYIKRILEKMATYTEKNGKFQLVGSLLYKVLDPADGVRVKSHALVIPRELVDTVLVNTHVELCHPGKKRLLEALKPRVYWKSMRKDVDRFVHECSKCRLKNLKAPVYSNIGMTPPERPMVKIAVDLWSCNFGTALTAMCLHSQYPFLVPLEDKSSKSAARAITEILAGIKTPKEILSDNGGEFNGKEFKEVLKVRRIKHIQPPPHSPRSNGILERFHRYLKQCLQSSLTMTDDATEWQWKGACVSALEAYRKTPHTSTGECPLFLASGQDPVYAIDHLLPTIPREAWNRHTGTISLDQLGYAHALARRNTILARLKHQGIRKERDPVLKAGDLVYKENLTGKKLDPKWIPGYRIQKMLSERTAEIKHIKTEKLERANVRHLKKSSPVRELMGNASGTPKLYVRIEDLPDLDWPAIDVPFDEEEERRQAAEIAKAQETGTRTQGSRRDVTQRERRPPAWMKNYI